MIVLGASWVLPVSGPPVRDGRVAVAGGVIQWVGRAGDPRQPKGEMRDLGAGVLLPGLVNAHCHLELSHCAGLAGRGAKGFVPWVERLVQERGALPEAEIVRHLTDAVRRIEEETATVAIGDVSNSLASVVPLSASRLHAVVFHELMGWDGAVVDAVLGVAAVQRERVAAKAGPRVRVSPAAHAPHSVSPSLFRALRARGGPYAVHLAESPTECRFLKDGSGDWGPFLASRGLGHVAFTPPGVSPVRYLHDLGALHARLLAAHAVHVSDVDIAILAQHGVSVVVCPSSNRNLDVGVAPVPRLLRGGVRVCLGTDSMASGDGIDVAVEMADLHRTYPELAPRTLLRMATLSGAMALGLTELGAIEPRRHAELAFAAGEAGDEPERFVVSGEVPLRRVAI